VAAVGLLAVGLLAVYTALWLRLGHDDLAGGDFSASYVAAQTWRAGDAAHIYDQAAQTARHQALLPGYRIDLPFITPPTTAVLAAPLTAVDADAAARLAGAAELACLVIAVVIVMRALPRSTAEKPGIRTVAALAALAGPGTCVLLWQAQWDGICALGLALGYVGLRRGHPLLAGLAVALGFLPVKPHLAVGIAAFLIVVAGARAAAGLALGAAATLVAGLAVDGLTGWRDWVGALGLSSAHSPLSSLLGYTGLFGSWLGESTVARTLGLATSAAAVLVCALLGVAVRRRPALLEPALAGAVALSLAAAPHLLAHDLAVLAPAAAWTLAWAAGEVRAGGGGRALRLAATLWALTSAAALLDLGNAALAPPGRLVPWALTAAGALAILASSSAGAYSGRGSGAGGLVDQS
jgi:glycosyl transferase family 87